MDRIRWLPIAWLLMTLTFSSAWAQTLLSSQDPSVNSVPLNVFRITTGDFGNFGSAVISPSNGSIFFDGGSIGPGSPLGFGALGNVTIPAAVPPGPVSFTPSNITGGFGVWGGAPRLLGPLPTIVRQRPDFLYNSNQIKFFTQTTSTTGQVDMGLAPGVPAGRKRYVPVGEF